MTHIKPVLKYGGQPVTHKVIVLIEGNEYVNILSRNAKGMYFKSATVHSSESSSTVEEIAKVLCRGFDVPIIDLGMFDPKTLEFTSEDTDSLFLAERNNIMLTLC